MLAHRTILAKAETFSIYATASCGLPQGGGLSPILWSLVADSLLKWLSKQGVFAQGFADDGAVLICGRILSTICDIMQRVLYGIQQWCVDRKLSVNPSKTEMVLFTRRYKPEKLKTITFFNNVLVTSDQVKYLGVILDAKLSWKQQVEAKCKKALALMCQLRRVTGVTWGMTPKTVFWLYTTIIRPYISYAVVVWWPRVNLKTVNNQFEHIQRLACLYITGAMRTTPTAALEIIVGLSPLPVYIRQEAMMACYRLLLNAQWMQANCGHMRIKTDLMINAPSSAMRSDKILPRFYFDKNYEVHIPTRDDWNESRVNLNDETVCFTDGSRINNTDQAGAGIYNQTDCEEYYYPLGCRCSVFQAEIYAILQCARLHSLRCRNSVSVAICSDSQAALKALITPKVSSALVAETVCALKELSVHNSVRLVWTPGHCGILGNEAADGLSRQASAIKYTGLEPVLGVTSPTVRNELQLWASREQWKQWREATKYRQAKQLLRQANLSYTKYALRLCRTDLRILVGLLTGHADLNRHLTLMQIRTDTVCPLCQEDEETVLHLLGECSALVVKRANILGSPYLCYEELGKMHWRALLRLAKASQRF